MKILVASDIHGSSYYAKVLENIIENDNFDKVILLGDIYNHGPRNALPKDYNPMAVAEILNKLKDKLIVIKGNCDSEVDKMISDFDFIDNFSLMIKDKTLFFTHGHIYNKDNLPKTKFDYLIYGHLHTYFIEKGKTTCINCGSISIPKNGCENSYMVIDDKNVTVYSCSKNKILQLSI